MEGAHFIDTMLLAKRHFLQLTWEKTLLPSHRTLRDQSKHLILTDLHELATIKDTNTDNDMGIEDMAPHF